MWYGLIQKGLLYLEYLDKKQMTSYYKYFANFLLNVIEKKEHLPYQQNVLTLMNENLQKSR